MCPDPLDMFLYPKSPSFWIIYGTFGIVILISYLTTGHPTLSDIPIEAKHLMHFLNQRLIIGIPNYIWFITTTIIVTTILLYQTWKDEKDYKYSHWKSWHELMFEYRHLYNEAESYYYGDISN